MYFVTAALKDYEADLLRKEAVSLLQTQGVSFPKKLCLSIVLLFLLFPHWAPRWLWCLEFDVVFNPLLSFCSPLSLLVHSHFHRLSHQPGPAVLIQFWESGASFVSPPANRTTWGLFVQHYLIYLSGVPTVSFQIFCSIVAWNIIYCHGF